MEMTDSEPAGEPDESVGSAEPPTRHRSAVRADADKDRAEPAPGGARAGLRLSNILIGILCALLGFALAVQLRTVDSDAGLAGAREEDLARILSDLQAREDRLRSEIGEQQDLLEDLDSGGDSAAAAIEEARRQAEVLGILNGTIAAQGPGLTITIEDRDGVVEPAIVLNAIQELRGAGAETMQVSGVRIGVSSAVTGRPGAIEVDGTLLAAPYVLVAIGDPQTLSTAMQIPGGVVDKVIQAGARIDVVTAEQVLVDALRPLDDPAYAEPAPGPDD